MVVHQDQHLPVGGEADQAEADQAGRAHIEAVIPVCGEHLVKAGPLRRRVQSAEVHLAEVEGHVAGHHLGLGAVGAALPEGAAQRGVAAHQLVCCGAQRGRVDAAGEFEDELRGVDAGR